MKNVSGGSFGFSYDKIKFTFLCFGHFNYELQINIKVIFVHHPLDYSIEEINV